MQKRWLGLIGAATAAVLAAGAAPAFTADTGTVEVRVTAQAAATPCITVAPSTLDFGTLPFSTVGTLSRRFIGGAGVSPTATNCGTVDQTMTITGSNASNATGTWTITGAADGTNPCPTVNQFNLTGHREADANQGIQLTTSPVLVRAVGGVGPYVQGPGLPDNFGFTLNMPCQGSNGAGEQKTMTVVFTAAIN